VFIWVPQLRAMVAMAEVDMDIEDRGHLHHITETLDERDIQDHDHVLTVREDIDRYLSCYTSELVKHFPGAVRNLVNCSFIHFKFPETNLRES